MSKALRMSLAIGVVLGLAQNFPSEADAKTLPVTRSGPEIAPGQIVEVTAPVAVIASTVHYQAELGLICSVGLCKGDFPTPGVKRQLNNTRIACFMDASNNSKFRFGAIDLIGPGNLLVLGETVPVDVSTADGRLHTLNRAVDIQIASNQHLHPHLDLSEGTANDAVCTVTGTLSKLE